MEILETANKDITVSHYLDDTVWRIDMKNGNHRPIYLTLEEIINLEEVLAHVIIKEYKSITAIVNKQL